MGLNVAILDITWDHRNFKFKEKFSCFKRIRFEGSERVLKRLLKLQAVTILLSENLSYVHSTECLEPLA